MVAFYKFVRLFARYWDKSWAGWVSEHVIVNWDVYVLNVHPNSNKGNNPDSSVRNGFKKPGM